VKRQTRYLQLFMIEPAQGGLLCAPVETGSPVIDKLSQVVKISSPCPTLTPCHCRPSDVLQSRLKIIQNRVRHRQDLMQDSI
jgi:hypothetical protein